jgi:tetratricopeptide (TPR) repeat protein
MSQAGQMLDAYQVRGQTNWRALPGIRYLSTSEQLRVAEDAQELLLLLAQGNSVLAENEPDSDRRKVLLKEAMGWNQLAATCAADSETGPAIWLQRAELAKALGNTEEARQAREQAARAAPISARDHFLLGFQYVEQRQYNQALKLLQKATNLNPRHSGAWHLQGVCHLSLGNLSAALTCYSCCIALWPDSSLYRHNRGLVHFHENRFADALVDFDEAIRLQPQLPEIYLDRALTQMALRNDKAATLDLTAALTLPGCPSRVYFLRSQAWEKQGKQDLAQRDMEAGLRTQPADEISWVARGLARLAKDPQGALADFEEALKLRPDSRAGLQNKAHVLSERLRRGDEALEASTRVVQLYPDFVPGRLGRGVLLARLGKRTEALQEARWCLDRDRSNPATVYQAANIYALTSRQAPADQETAHALLAVALHRGFGLDIVDSDSDFDAIRNQPAFRQIVADARAHHAAVK